MSDTEDADDFFQSFRQPGKVKVENEVKVEDSDESDKENLLKIPDLEDSKIDDQNASNEEESKESVEPNTDLQEVKVEKFSTSKKTPKKSSKSSKNIPAPKLADSDDDDWDPNRPVPEYNILLLGETGAGKSTTINAFANYLKYASFEAAKTDEFAHLIPSKFTLPDPDTGEPIDIQSGADDNEKHGDGASSTQSPVAYTFRMKDRLLRIIDTPGMGDTQGVDIDKENFDKILAHLHNYKHLHGICLLMKSNETRKTAFFRYCITELLTHLHKSACLNIVFCFTFSRNSFYGPGEGYATLRGFLQNDLKEVQLKLKPNHNCYFIDNEAYRFLVAQKKGYPFPDDQEASYKDSWLKSVAQSNAMWNYIQELVPHELESTCSLNNARKLILELAEPMIQLQKNINANIAHIKSEEQRVLDSTENKKELAKNLMLEVDDLEMEPLGYPRTVCTAAKCTEVIKYQGAEKIHYKTHCHKHCGLNSVTVNSVGDPILKGCDAMAGQTHCRICGCPWQVHMHVQVEYIKVKRSIIDLNKQKEIKNTEDAIRQIESALKTMRNAVREYETEYKVIQNVSSKFAYILISNSNTYNDNFPQPYNRFIEPYLDLLMDEEMKKIHAVNGYPRTVYESLQKMKETHQENVRILTDAINNKSQQNVRLEDIYNYRDELYALKHSGPQFVQMMQTSKWAKKKEFQMMKEQGLDLTHVVKNAANSVKNTAKKWASGIFGNSGNSGGSGGSFSRNNQNKNIISFTNSGPKGPKYSQNNQNGQSKLSQDNQQQQSQQHYDSRFKCFICEDPHKTIFCRKFTPEMRGVIVEHKKLCPICLIPGHQLIECINDYKCAVCKAKHSIVICTKNPGKNSSTSGGGHGNSTGGSNQNRNLGNNWRSGKKKRQQ